MDQSDGGMMNEDNQSMFFGATNNADFVGGPNNAEQSYSNKVFIQNITLKSYFLRKMLYIKTTMLNLTILNVLGGWWFDKLQEPTTYTGRTFSI